MTSYSSYHVVTLELGRHGHSVAGEVRFPDRYMYGLSEPYLAELCNIRCQSGREEALDKEE